MGVEDELHRGLGGVVLESHVERQATEIVRLLGGSRMGVEDELHCGLGDLAL